MPKFSGDFTFLDTFTKRINYLLVLNWKINYNLFNILKKCAYNIVFTDGATNYFHSQIQKGEVKPRFIIGDMDSIKPDVSFLVKKLGITFYEDHDEYTNDFEKALNKIIEIDKSEDIVISVMGGFGGRIDQSFANFSTTQKFSKSNHNLDIFLIDEHSLVYSLKANQKYNIKISKLQSKIGCGLIPFGKAKITTEGLRWNIGTQYGLEGLQFGNFISSSNQIVQEEVCIIASSEIFWTTTINLTQL